MSASPRHRFERLFAQLTQGMSAPGAPVVSDLGTKAAAEQTGDDRLEWLPARVSVASRPFTLPDGITPDDQAVDFAVKIHGSSFERVLELHGLLVGWLDELIGPWQGCAPSDDAERAEIVGTVDLAAVSYPTAILEGLHLDFIGTAARRVTFPGTTLASAQAIVDTINVAVNAIQDARQGLLRVRTYLRDDGAGHTYLVLYAEPDPLSAVGPVIALDPTVIGSACAALGFSSVAGNLTATGTPPKRPYRPGYRLGESERGPVGGNVGAATWALTVPVRLFTPIKSQQYRIGTFQRMPITSAATGGTMPDDELMNPGA